MIHSLIFTNHQGDSIKVVLTDSEPDHGILITRVNGLGPPKAQINSSTVVGYDGSIFNSAKVGDRNINIDMIFVPARTIEDTRQRVYRYFPIKKRVTIGIETDNHYIETSGIIENNDPNIFSEKEGCSISIICDDPYFHSVRRTVLFSGYGPAFSFPFKNESLTEKQIKFGTVENKTENVVYYEGDSDIGIDIFIHINGGDIGDISIHNIRTRAMMKLISNKITAISGAALKAGDDIIINTQKGNKKVSLLRDGKTINLLNALDPESTWLTISKGDNLFAYSAVGFQNISFNIQFDVVYEGV